MTTECSTNASRNQVNLSRENAATTNCWLKLVI